MEQEILIKQYVKTASIFGVLILAAFVLFNIAHADEKFVPEFLKKKEEKFVITEDFQKRMIRSNQWSGTLLELITKENEKNSI